MNARIALAVALLGTAASALAKPTACKGTISGSVKGKFDCDAGVVVQDGVAYFVIRAKAPIVGVPGYTPGSFVIPEKPAAKTYTLDTLGEGRASVAAEGGTLYTAHKTMTQRGEVTLTFRSVKKEAAPDGTLAVRGRYRARLLPVGDGKKGAAVIEVVF